MKTNSIIKILWKSLFSLILLANVAYGGATLTVNSIGSGEACDNVLTLAEATHLGRGGFGRPLTNSERNQISGGNFVAAPLPPECAGSGWLVVNGLGPNDADDIVFNGTLTLPINYGIILGKNDDIDGNSSGVKVILDGSSQPSGTRGIDIEQDSGSQVRNLVIRNFPSSGIFAQRMNGGKFEGLDIFGNSGNGISLGFNGNFNSRNVTIGGDQPQHRNRIFSNGADGIFIGADPAHDRMDQAIFILNNLIGTSDGVTDNGNSGRGISLINTVGVYVGDLTGATHNIISGNNNDGIALEGAGAIGNRIIANYIGTTESSGAPLGNTSSGIALLNDAGSTADFVTSFPNRIGQAGLGNVISANNYGIFIADPNTSLNQIQGNLIGTNVGGNTDLGNALDGIYFVNGTYVNTIGGTNAGEGNLIAFNRNGIRADSGIRNSFRRNRIFSNDLLGIDLAPVGVTPNDAGDGDGGPNNLQNFPVITYVNAQASSVTLEGTFNSRPNQTFTLEFFGNSGVDASGFGEGRNFLGSTQVTTNAGGNATFFGLNFAVSSTTVGNWVTATATGDLGDTSEYSQARNICSDMRLSPVSILAPLGGISTSFTYINSTGCSAPTAVSNSSWITVGSVGSGTVNFTVAANTGPPRDGLINVNYNNGTGQSTTSFLVSQNNGCSYSINPTSLSISGAGGNSTVNVVVSNGCTWTAASNAAWITITGGGTGTGSGPVSFTVQGNAGAARSGTISVAGQTFTVNQGAACTNQISTQNTNFSALGGSGIFSVTTGAGCTWTATSTVNWITITSGGSGTGNGTGNFTVAANSGPDRTGTITTGPTSLTISQGGCSILGSISPSSANFGAVGGNGNFSVTSSCGWTATSNSAWITITGGSPGTGNGTVSFTVQANTGQARIGTISTIFGQTFTVNQSGGKAPFDFDGDGKTDISIFRPAVGEWWYLKSSNGGNAALQFGQSTDKLTPGDFTGDGKADVAFWRPTTGEWFVLRSENLSFYSFQFGSPGDIPAPADYDGDGKTDAAVFRPSTATWYISRSSGGTTIQQFGASSDFPVAADYDGDGKSDIAIYRANGANQEWWYQKSSNLNVVALVFGITGDKAVQGDYTGDGKADIAVWRPSSGDWLILRSENLSFYAFPFGSSGDVPTPGDYDGDGRFDAAVFRPSSSTWYVQRTTAGTLILAFGISGDKPVPSVFVP